MNKKLFILRAMSYHKIYNMKYSLLVLFLLSLFLFSCTEKVKKNNVHIGNEIQNIIKTPNTKIEESLLFHDKNKSLWTLNGELYSGYSMRYYQDGTIKQQIGILNGRKHNQSIEWFSDGHIKCESNYIKGKLSGEKKTWFPGSDHILKSKLNYQFGKADGEQKTWYLTGEIYKILNLNMGKEDGIQRAYRKNGELYANYEAKEGRIFGLKKTSLCYGLEDEKIKYEN